MPRNLDPQIIALEQRLVRGVIAILPARGSTGTQVRLLRFQYNPETITRTRQGQWETRENQNSNFATPQERSLQDAHRGGGLFAKSETISLKLVFDTEELLSRNDATVLDLEQGVLPELAVLESIALAKPNRDDGSNSSGRDNDLVSLAPSELLLILGPRRYPVVITNLTITEQRFSHHLAPVRAECDLKLRVLEATEVAGNSTVTRTFTQLLADRASAAEEGYWGSADDTESAITAALENTAAGEAEGG